MIDSIFKAAIFIGAAGAVYLVSYGIMWYICRRRRQRRLKMKARAERYEEIERFRAQADYHASILRSKQIAEGRYIYARGREIADE